MTEIQLLPVALGLKNTRSEIVNCRAPSVTMFGPGKLAVKAYRIGVCRWRVTTFSNKPRWWKRPVIVPQCAHSHWRFLHSLTGHVSQHYRYFRFVDVAYTSPHVEIDFLGPDNHVMAYSVPPAHTTSAGTRRVLYLSAHDAGDGLYTPPDETCIVPVGGPIRMHQPSAIALRECEAHRLMYLAMLSNRAAGRTIQVGHEWITPVEQERRWQLEETERKRLRLAHGR